MDHFSKGISSRNGKGLWSRNHWRKYVPELQEVLKELRISAIFRGILKDILTMCCALIWFGIAIADRLKTGQNRTWHD